MPVVPLSVLGSNGPETIAMDKVFAGRKVVVFALPGAFTSICTSAHVPSFINVADALRDKGVDQIICISVNDMAVMDAWAKSTGGADAGITFLADMDGSFTKAAGFNFDAPIFGYFGRSKRYAALVDDGVISILNAEQKRGVCELSSGETLLAQMN